MSSKNTATLTLDGDASDLQKAFGDTREGLKKLTGDATDESNKFGKALGGTSDAASGLVKGLGNLGNSVSDVSDVFNVSQDRAQRLAKAQQDLQQAQQDYTQAVQDGKQAQQAYNQALQDGKQASQDYEQAERDLAQSGIDVEQGQLNLSKAQKAYTAAVKAHGKTSDEAKQALIDQKQAEQDLKQAQDDGKQATLDAQQATKDQGQASLDAKQALNDQKQATLDAKGAQLDLNDASREAKPPPLGAAVQLFGDLTPAIGLASEALEGNRIKTVGLGLAQGVTAGATGAWTGVQWLLNAAMDASPVVWITLAVIALIAVIVLIATKTDWFQKGWSGAWGGIKSAAGAVSDFFVNTVWHNGIEKALDGIVTKAAIVFNFFRDLPGKVKGWLGGLGDIISGAFKGGLNAGIDILNRDIGFINDKLIDTANLVPFVHIPHIPPIPRLHSGGTVPGFLGQEVLTVLRAGELVQTEAEAKADARGGGDTYHTYNITVDGIDELAELLDWLDGLRNNARRGVNG